MTAQFATTRLAATAVACALLLIGCDDAAVPLTQPITATPAAPRFAVTQGPNLIANPSLETTGTGGDPANWTRIYWGSPTPTFTYPVNGNGSSRAARISYSQNSTGGARFQHNAVAVTPGVTYTFTESYKSTAATLVDIEYTSTSGAISYGWIANVASSGNAWRQFTGTVVIPTGVTKIAVFHMIDKAGSLTIDDASLTAPITPPVVSITASPSSIGVGQSSVLSWSATSATSCTASGAWSGAKATSGSTTVAPTTTSTYSLTCTGSGGTTSASATVTVSTTPPPTTFAQGMITLSFDDSWLSQYTNALPVLQAANLKATFYLCSSPLAEFWTGFMTPAMAQDIAAKGHEIAGHTQTHADLTTLTQAGIDAQLRDSKTYLQSLTGQQVTSFAYPYGVFNAAVKASVAPAGYTSGRGVSYDVQNTPNTDKLDLKSLTFLQSQTIAEIKAQIDQARANKTWFIMTIHEINIGGDVYTNSVARLQEVVNYVKSTGIKVVTVREGRALMN